MGFSKLLGYKIPFIPPHHKRRPRIAIAKTPIRVKTMEKAVQTLLQRSYNMERSTLPQRGDGQADNSEKSFC